jgi:hypothetical protein
MFVTLGDDAAAGRTKNDITDLNSGQGDFRSRYGVARRAERQNPDVLARVLPW